MPAPFEKRARAGLGIPFTILAIVVSFVLGGLTVYLRGNPSSSTETLGTSDSSSVLDKVVALGRIEPEEGVRSLGVAVPDRIAKIQVEEGAHVKQNDVLVVLDSLVMRDLETKLADIQRREAEKRRDAITASGEAQIEVEKTRQNHVEQVEPLEIEAQEGKIKFLKAQKANAEKDAQRYAAAGDTISEQDKEKQKLLLSQIRAELVAAECLLKKMNKAKELNRNLAETQLKAARADLERNRSAISLDLLDRQCEQARQRLKDARLLAPIDGKVLRVLAREGELVGGQPILQLANTSQMIVLAEVYETDIQRVRIGQEATVTSHVFKRDHPLKGKVIWKGSSIGKARVTDLDPRASVDNRVVEVKIKLDESERVADLIGHQVRVEILTGGS
jgi:HlyD family secretion protein